MEASIHYLVNGEERASVWHDILRPMQLEPIGEEGINIHVTDANGIEGMRVDLSADLIKALYAVINGAGEGDLPAGVEVVLIQPL